MGTHGEKENDLDDHGYCEITPPSRLWRLRSVLREWCGVFLCTILIVLFYFIFLPFFLVCSMKCRSSSSCMEAVAVEGNMQYDAIRITRDCVSSCHSNLGDVLQRTCFWNFIVLNVLQTSPTLI